jgi:hypothetical protein
MSKVLQASCVGGVVTAGDPIPLPVLSADILSEGVGPSEGILVMDEDEATYVTSNASDLKTTIDKLASSLNTIGNALTSIASQMLGPATAPPPTLPLAVAELTATATQLSLLKETLK